MNSFIVGLLLVAAPLAFAAFLLFFMMSGKGTKPLNTNETENAEQEKDETKKKVIENSQDDL